jgi:tripartite-type tricarboxylate transporter receptor subunit TctC
MNLVKKVAGCALGAAALACCATAWADAAAKYPEHPVKLIVPFNAGGVADAVARIAAQGLTKQWKQSVIVENKPGAGGNIGMAMGAKADPDGYTLVLAPVGNMTVVNLLFPKLNFKPSDFAAVTELAASPNVLVVGKKLNVKTFPAFVAYAKAHPGEVDFASPGVGSGAHLAGELLNQMAGIKMLHVPYSGLAPALNDVIAGNVDAIFSGISTILPYMKDKRLTPLAVAGPARLPELPDVPTVAEEGYKGFDVTSWYGLVAPKGVPPAILAKIQRDASRVMLDPALKNKLSVLGVVAVGSSSEAFSEKIATDTKNWGDIIRKAHIKPLQ